MNYIRLSLILFTIFIPAWPAGAVDLSRAVIYDYPLAELMQKTGQVPGSQLTTEDMAQIRSFRFDGDTCKILVILVDWSNRPGTYSRETIDSMYFSRGVFPGGSVADYYSEVSYGQITILGDVIDWQTQGFYDGSGFFDFRPIMADVDPFVDYSQYDGNGDGFVDAVAIVRAGTGQEDSQDDADIWSYAVTYTQYNALGPYDGVRILRWNACPELYPLHLESYPPVLSGETTLNRIRVPCHELGHNLGLPDLYDYDDKLVHSTYYTPGDNNDHPVIDWCLMGYYGYGHLSMGSIVPSHFCGWSRQNLGWIEPTVLIGEYTDLVINNIETTPDSSLFQIPINAAQGEYFLIEYRNPYSTAQFDKFDSDFSCYFYPALSYGPEPLDRGLIIMHVHDSLETPYWFVNDGTPTYAHYKVAVEDAGYDPDHDASYNPEGHVTDSSQWWYPYETRRAAAFSYDVAGQNLFGPETNPSSDGYFGPSGIVVRVDSIVDDKLYAYVYNPLNDEDMDGVDDSFDNCPGVYNPDQGDDDSDGLGNLCDNCPGQFNTGQEDADGDGVGDLCDICPGFDDTVDTDGDNVPDGCDLCAGYDDGADGDGDSVPDSCDNCPETANVDQADSDENGIGDVCDYVCGDANGDGSCNVGDAVHLINYVFKSGPAPDPIEAGDANGDGDCNVGDAVYIIAFVFNGGPAPVCP